MPSESTTLRLDTKTMRQPGDDEGQREYHSSADGRDDEASQTPLHVPQRGGQHWRAHLLSQFAEIPHGSTAAIAA